MKIVYVAKHNSGYNDDEGSISHALKKLGHEVVKIPERVAKYQVHLLHRGDFLLFHHWHELATLRSINIPKVFWNFDLVTYPDDSLVSRNLTRISWMHEATNSVDIGFCSDGDWVNQDKTGKLVRLVQGADERIVGPGNPQHSSDDKSKIVFTGTYKAGGSGRNDFMRDMLRNHRPHFSHYQKVFQRDLADLLLGRVAIAPDHPITDNYWSNRVYVTLGFGGLLIHPYCKTLSEHYDHEEEILFYRTNQEMHSLAYDCVRKPQKYAHIRKAALKRTREEHLYRHRCEKLIQIVQERLF